MSEDEVKEKAKAIGFDACGIATAEPFGDDMRRWRDWLSKGYNATMAYMERRVNPSDILENAKSVVVCLMNHYPTVTQDKDEPQIAKYAYSTDYHYIIWEKLKLLADSLGLEEYAVACDTMPVFDRALAVRAGLGWIGKNNMLVNPKFGSYTFIGELFTTLPLIPDLPTENRCGKCRKCLDSCPTGALTERCLNANKCLSYRTIESKEPLTEEEARHNWVFGCDMCQMACPWNEKLAQPNNHTELKPITLELQIPTLTNSVLRKGKSPFCRSNLTKLKENHILCISNHQNS